MDFEFSAEERAFADQVREFLEAAHAEDVMQPHKENFTQLVDTPPKRSFLKELGAKGWLGITWPSEYGGGGESVVFEHPLMSEAEMLAANAEVLWRGYSLGRVLKRTFHAITHGCSTEVAKNAFFMQLGLRKEYRQVYDQVQARP